MDKFDEIKVRHDACNTYGSELDAVLTHQDRAWLIEKVEELKALVRPKIIPHLITECNHAAGMKVCNNCQQRNTIFQMDEANQKLKATLQRVGEIPDKLRDDFSRGGMPTGVLEAIWYIEEALEGSDAEPMA